MVYGPSGDEDPMSGIPTALVHVWQIPAWQMTYPFIRANDNTNGSYLARLDSLDPARGIQSPSH